MESEKISFVKYIDKSFNVFQQLRRFRKGDRKQIFNYLFNAHHIPRMKTWFMAGELVVWGLWCFVTYSVIVDDRLPYIHKPHYLSLGCWAFALLFFGKKLVTFVTYAYIPLCFSLDFAQKTKNFSGYWIKLWAWTIFCFVFSLFAGGKDMIEGTMRDGSAWAEPAVWEDWFDIEHNILILVLGYPMLLSVTIGTVIISIFYYYYKPQTKNNEGLDSDFVDDDDYLD